MIPKDEKNYNWDIETSWSQGFNQGKKETIAKLRIIFNNFFEKYLCNRDECDDCYGLRMAQKEVLKLLEDIK